MTSKIRQNYHEECEALINKQINMEFYASYVYLSMASYFNRDDQALSGFASFFQKNSNEERDHGMKLMTYQAKRGGRVVFQDIAKPSSMKWRNQGDGRHDHQDQACWRWTWTSLHGQGNWILIGSQANTSFPKLNKIESTSII